VITTQTTHPSEKCTLKTPLLLLPTLIVAANAATITNYTDVFSPTTSIQYTLTVNNGGNPTSAQFINGPDPAILSRLAVTANIADGLIVDYADLDLTLTGASLSWSRDASTFTGVTSTWNPTFTAPHDLDYTINVSSSAGSNSYLGSGSTTNLDLLAQVNFASLLDQSATSRQITISWQDTIDFGASAMPKDSLPRNGTYRWNLSSGVSSATDLQVTTSEPVPPSPVPEPSSMFLFGSGLAAAPAVLRFRKKNK
jgi:hypothetical protein